MSHHHNHHMRASAMSLFNRAVNMEHHKSEQQQEQQQPFPNVENGTVPPYPSELWAAQIRNPPLPTNSAWLNFVLNQGSCVEYLHPYMIQSSSGKLTVCYPTRGPNADFIFQCFVANLSVSCQEEGQVSHVVSQYDDLSVTLDFGSRLSVPLVRGSPYVTFIFKNGTPLLSTIHAVLELHSNEDSTRHKLVMNNGQTWIIYCSSPLQLDKNLNVGAVGGQGFTGVMRIALIPDGGGRCSATLDRYSKCYPVAGMADLSVPFQVKYVWEKKGWGELLMLSLPYHREILTSHSVQLPSLSYTSIDGPLQGVVGGTWILKEAHLSVNWYSSQGVGAEEARNDIVRALEVDVAALNPIFNPSTYFHGKALARAARLALIAEELGSPHLVEKVRAFLVDSITPWFRGTFSGNALVYDPKWGGLVSREGSKDPGADFGLAMYNDHHYHHGYFCYAGAVLAKLDPAWGRAFKSHLYALVGDFMTYNSTDSSSFTRLRCFDPWKMHSWAGGLTEFADGRNQESTSEAVNAYYSAALVGLAYGDSDLINLGLTLTALEIRASQALWHIRCDSTLYEPEFVKNNRVVGVLWANKRDNGLWFASKDCREMRLGIQVLPITPITEVLFRDKQFAQELVDWTMPVLNREGVTDGWRGFVYALLAVYEPHTAHQLVSQLADHDDGNSLSNLLWWIHSRPRC
ncbi:unnamed protein product [Calypogeia fissa]